MVKESIRKCSYCGNNGHNSRTCNGNHHHHHEKACVKLFGVSLLGNKHINTEPMKKSLSMGNLKACDVDNNTNNGNNGYAADDAGYLSDGLIHNKKCKAAHERRKGKPWSEEEHRTFLTGLRKLGKGDWRGIAKNYVMTRTPTQVASHAQKYFLRQHAATDYKKKRRSSLFDMPLTDADALAALDSPTSSKIYNNSERPKQIETQVQVQILNRFPHLCLDSPPGIPIPTPSVIPLNYHAVSYMQGGVPPDVSLVPMLSFGSKSFPCSKSKSLRKMATCAPVIMHPSGIPSPRSNSTQTAFQEGRSSISSEKDGLELKIGQPQSSQGTNSSSPTSGAISVT